MEWNLQLLFSARCEGYNECCLDNRFVLPSCDYIWVRAFLIASHPRHKQ